MNMTGNTILEAAAKHKTVTPVYDFPGCEDLIGIPGTSLLLASVQGPALQTAGRLELVDTQKRATHPLYPAPAASIRFNAETFKGLPEEPPAHFIPHGLTIRPGSNGVHQVYVVHHGERESIEVFQLEMSGPEPKVIWEGSVPTPDSVTGNAVAPAPDKGFVMSRTILPIPKKDGPPPDFDALESTQSSGELWAWNPAAGWSRVDTAGIDLMPNGVELSADGKWIYYADSMRHSFNRLSVGRNPLIKEVLYTGFHTDNVHWSEDRKSLILAGQQGGMRQIVEFFMGKPGVTCGNAMVVRINPETLGTELLVNAEGFSLASGAVEINGKIWIGRIRGTLGCAE